MESKTEKFKQFVAQNFMRVTKQETKESLGDRSTYIGASDIGGCPYQTVMSKKHPPQYPIEKLIMFEFGHMAENIVSKMLQGLNVLDQYEALGEIDQFSLKAHIDRLIQSSSRDVIVEVKTVGAPVSEPYESWVLQVTYQMGLVMQENPAKELDGYVLAMDRATGWFDVFKIEFDDDIFEICLSKASHLISSLRGECEPKAIVQYYCSDCPFKLSCPKQGQFAEDLPLALHEDLEFIKAAKVMQKEARKREERVKSYMVNMGIEALKEETTQTVVTTKEMQSNRVDIEKLKERYPQVYEECVKTSSYYRMNVL